MESKYRSFDDLPLALRVEDLMPILDIGRNSAYELVRSGAIRSVKIGRQLRIPKQAIINIFFIFFLSLYSYSSFFQIQSSLS